jgi:hypothetical protein
MVENPCHMNKNMLHTAADGMIVEVKTTFYV